jgi:hypothetical protein
VAKRLGLIMRCKLPAPRFQLPPENPLSGQLEAGSWKLV